jgi:two-component system nitrate/nitrite response regulator NarL
VQYAAIIGNAETYGPQHAEWTFSEPPVVTADLVSDVRQLRRDGHSVLVVIRGMNQGLSSALLAAGACVLQGMEESLSTLATVVNLMLADTGNRVDDAAGLSGRVPHLSDREISVLRAYTSGLTLDAVARKLGIRQSTAKTYLKRVKEKYEEVGRPAYTKLDLASRVREDNFSLTAERAVPVPSDGIVLNVNPRGTYLIEVTLGSATGDFDQAPRTDDRFEVA